MDEKTQGIAVILEQTGSRKIEVIKQIREMSGLGLKAAKTATEQTPACVKIASSRYEAEQAIERLRLAGATAQAVDADSPTARSATPLETFRELSKPAASSGSFYRVGFWILLLIVLYLWFRSA